MSIKEEKLTTEVNVSRACGALNKNSNFLVQELCMSVVGFTKRPSHFMIAWFLDGLNLRLTSSKILTAAQHDPQS